MPHCLHSLFQSLEVEVSASNLKWYKHSTKFKKTLLLLILRAQKAVSIQIGPMAEMSVETFSNVSNYFTNLYCVTFNFPWLL